MERILDVLTKRLKPSGPDLEILGGRGDTHFSQKVRNLTSHRTLTKPGFATYEDGIYRITRRGRLFLEEAEPVYEALEAQGFGGEVIGDELERGFKDMIVEEGAADVISVMHRERSRRLRKIAMTYFSEVDGGTPSCVVCGFNFEKRYGERGKEYIEIHHRVPIHTMDIRGTAKHLKTALNSLVAVCSNCHRMIHRKRRQVLSPEELKTLIRL